MSSNRPAAEKFLNELIARKDQLAAYAGLPNHTEDDPVAQYVSALNFLRIGLGWCREGDPKEVLMGLSLRDSIENFLQSSRGIDRGYGMDDIRNLPVFASSVGVIGTHLCDVDVGPVRNLIGLLDLRRSSQGSRASKERRVGLLVSSPRQVVACLKVALDSGDIFVVFNSRSAEEHLHGGAVIALTTIQRTSEYITVLFRRSHCWGPTDSPELTVEEMEANTKVKVSAPAVMIISQAELRLVDQARESQRQLNEALERVRTLERNLEQQEQHTIRLHEANEQLRQRLEGGRSQASGSTRAPSPSQNSIRPDHRASDYWVPGDHNRPPSVFSTSSAPFVTAHSEPPSREAGFSHSYAGSYRASQFNVDTLDHRMSQASIEEAEEDVDDHFTLNSDDDPGTPTQTYIQPYVTDPYTTFNAPRANTLSPSPSYMSPAPSYRSEWRNESRRIASPGEASTSSSFGTMSNRLMPINETHPLPPTPPPEALATYIPPLSPHRTVGVPGHHCDLCPHEHPDFDFVPLDPCAHSFGRDCLKEYVEAQVLADIHPIYCPECVKRNVSPNITGRVTQDTLEIIGAGEEMMDLFIAAEMQSHGESYTPLMLITCGRCHGKFTADDDEDLDGRWLLECPLPRCAYQWCKLCDQEVPRDQSLHIGEHDCPGLEEWKGARRLDDDEYERLESMVEDIQARNDRIIFTVCIDAETSTLEDGSPADRDDLEMFQPWKELFLQSVSNTPVKKFVWLVNPVLEGRFDTARDALRRRGRSTQEHMLFHGTQVVNTNNILKVGLHVGGTHGVPVTNGAVYGPGIYLSASAATAISYADGENKIIACRVLLGSSSTTVLPTAPTGPVGSEAFDSYSGAGFYVVRHAEMVLPCYMIEW